MSIRLDNLAALGRGNRNSNVKVTKEKPKLLGVHGEEYIVDKVLILCVTS
jgi:hypothetical protein